MGLIKYFSKYSDLNSKEKFWVLSLDFLFFFMVWFIFRLDKLDNR